MKVSDLAFSHLEGLGVAIPCRPKEVRVEAIFDLRAPQVVEAAVIDGGFYDGWRRLGAEEGEHPLEDSGGIAVQVLVADELERERNFAVRGPDPIERQYLVDSVNIIANENHIADVRWPVAGST